MHPQNHGLQPLKTGEFSIGISGEYSSGTDTGPHNWRSRRGGRDGSEAFIRVISPIVTPSFLSSLQPSAVTPNAAPTQRRHPGENRGPPAGAACAQWRCFVLVAAQNVFRLSPD